MTNLEWDYVTNNPVRVKLEARQAIREECDSIKETLLAKNAAYGNSALDPTSFLSNADAVDRLAVRIDDKLNRIVQGKEYPGDDTILDLIGYLVLFRIARSDSE